MKFTWLLCVLLLFSCSKKEVRDQPQSAADDERQIEQLITNLCASVDRAYNTGGVNTDSLIDAYYQADVHYITPWGWTEPLDTTKARLRNAAKHVTNYGHRVENIRVKSYGDEAYAFYILRQNYQVDGSPLDEYLPTTLVLERQGSVWKIVHAHRSTDFETFRQYEAMQQKREGTK